jgi:DNA polymerase III sliding clamp (beta) subunit (PCNA family)
MKSNYSITAPASVFTELFNIMAVLTNEAEFNITNEGLEASIMDAGKVALLQLNYPKSKFTDYQTSQTLQTVRFNLVELQKYLKRIKPAETVTLIGNPSTSITLKTDGSIVREWEIPTFGLENNSKPQPKLQHNVSMNIDAKTLYDCLVGLQLSSDLVKITPLENSVTFFADGDRTKSKVVLTVDGKVFKMLTVESSDSSVYSMVYLSEMVKAAGNRGLLIQYSMDMPIQITYDDMDEDSVVFIMAPRVESSGD